MEKQVERFIFEQRMAERGETWIVGVSGGADSVCLLHILNKLSGALGIQLIVCHVIHGIRGAEAEADAAFVEKLCGELNLPVRIVRFDVPSLAASLGMSMEEAGRYARRQAFSELMEETGARKIALAHHMDDLAETVFMNCARGTGIRGMAAIRPVRGSYVRPLLCVSRAEIEAYLHEIGCSYCTDSTNADTEITRNAVRNILLPQTEKMVNKKTRRHLVCLAREAGEVSDFLDLECEERRGRYIKRSGDCLLICDDFRAETHLMQSLITRSVLREIAGTEKDITRRHVEDVLLLFEKKGGRRIDLPYGLQAVRKEDGVRIGRRQEAAQNGSPYEILLKEGTFPVADGVLSLEIINYDGSAIPRNVYTKTFDYDKIKGILKLRVRRPGDYLVIHPDGRRKSFSNYLTDMKVEHSLRDSIPLVTCGQEVLWAIGMRSGESCRIDMATTRVIVMTFTKDKTEETNERCY